MPQLRITLGKDGKVVAEGVGDTGENCLEKTKFLEKLFGEVENRELKPEYFAEGEVKLRDSLPEGYCG